MPLGRFVATALFLSLLCTSVGIGQYQPPSDYLAMSGDRASTWSDGQTNIVLIHGPVTIQTDRSTMTADRAVIWLTPLPGTVLDQQSAQIALIGQAKLALPQQQVERSGDTLFVTTEVQGVVRLTANQRVAQDLSGSDLYRDAAAMRPRPRGEMPTEEPARSEWLIQRPWITPLPQPAPTTLPTTRPVRPSQRFSIQSPNGKLETITTADQKMAALLTGGVTIIQTRSNGEVTQLQADRVVVFTPLSSLQDLSAVEQLKTIEDAITAVYLEGDVRVVLTPGSLRRGSEQRLQAQRVYYDFTTDRAVLTDAVIHTTDPQRQLPVTMRAQLVRQLSTGEYEAQKVELSTSNFAVPSYSIQSDRAYLRQYDTGDVRLGQRTVFSARNNTFDVHHVPVFYWPWAAGSLTDRGMPLRSVLFGSSSAFGFSGQTEWGLFETIGRPPPQDLDITYKLDYYGDRGPGGGIDANYRGGAITETSRQPRSFEGDFTSYFVSDHGIDRLSRERRVEPSEDLRYRALWQHQQFFPDDWQLQLRAGLVSDPTFLEQWFRDDFNNGLPHDVSAYLKRQRATEAITLAINFQPNDFVTTADLSQEQFEVEHLPELGYYRTGDSFAGDQLTYFGANTISGLRFNQSTADPVNELRFRGDIQPGLPSLGTTGVIDDMVYRGDFRHEIDYPLNMGQFRVMPYIMARNTIYSDSPEDSSQNRVFVGTGVRFNTSFWKVDDSARGDLFDIHRLRHVVEPEIHLFTSASTTERRDVYDYEEPVDAINDITGVQLALRQRWQTKRGGPGQWRSVDFFSFNLEANFFANQPDDAFLSPTSFRGLFFSSQPEASIPRNSINADALWRLSDSTAILSDMQYNLDDQVLATTSIGLAAQRDSRMSYYLGARYIGQINTMLATFTGAYELTSKYSLRVTQSFNLTEQRNQNSSVTVIRHFDRFFITFTGYYDAIDDEAGFRFGIIPEGLGFGVTSDQLQRAMGPQ